MLLLRMGLLLVGAVGRRMWVGLPVLLWMGSDVYTTMTCWYPCAIVSLRWWINRKQLLPFILLPRVVCVALLLQLLLLMHRRSAHRLRPLRLMHDAYYIAYQRSMCDASSTRAPLVILALQIILFRIKVWFYAYSQHAFGFGWCVEIRGGLESLQSTTPCMLQASTVVAGIWLDGNTVPEHQVYLLETLLLQRCAHRYGTTVFMRQIGGHPGWAELVTRRGL